MATTGVARSPIPPALISGQSAPVSALIRKEVPMPHAEVYVYSPRERGSVEAGRMCANAEHITGDMKQKYNLLNLYLSDKLAKAQLASDSQIASEGYEVVRGALQKVHSLNKLYVVSLDVESKIQNSPLTEEFSQMIKPYTMGSTNTQ